MLVHLYGVVPTSEPFPEGRTGRAGQPVRVIGDDLLGVVASDIDDHAKVRREDLLAHAHLLEQLSETMTVIPIQFGVVMPDDESVRRELLVHRRDELAALLRAFAGVVQVTVAAKFDEAGAMREVLRRSPDVAALRTSASQAPAVDVSDQVRLGEAVAAELDLLREEAADLVVERLSQYVRGIAPQQIRGAYDAVNVALLVERATRPKLDTAVQRLATEVENRMTIRYVGPQPPYAFIDEPVRESRWA